MQSIKKINLGVHRTRTFRFSPEFIRFQLPIVKERVQYWV